MRVTSNRTPPTPPITFSILDLSVDEAKMLRRLLGRTSGFLTSVFNALDQEMIRHLGDERLIERDLVDAHNDRIPTIYIYK